MITGVAYVEDVQVWMGPEMMRYWPDRNRPNLEMAQSQHDGLVAVLVAEGVEVVHLKDPLPHMTKSIFTHDLAIITKGEAIFCCFGID